MTYYRVELEALGRLTKQVRHCADDMREVMRLLKNIGPKGAGHAELEKACDDFQDAWGYGIGLIADAADGISEGLSQTHRVYQETEQKTAETFAARNSGGA